MFPQGHTWKCATLFLFLSFNDFFQQVKRNLSVWSLHKIAVDSDNCSLYWSNWLLCRQECRKTAECIIGGFGLHRLKHYICKWASGWNFSRVRRRRRRRRKIIEWECEYILAKFKPRTHRVICFHNEREKRVNIWIYLALHSTPNLDQPPKFKDQVKQTLIVFHNPFVVCSFWIPFTAWWINSRWTSENFLIIINYITL